MDIREILAELNIPFREHGSSSLVTENWVGIVCPMPGCGQGGKFGRGIHVSSLATTCWKCGPERISTVLAAASGRDIGQVAKLVKGADRLFVPREAKSTGKYNPPRGVAPLLPIHQQYLKKRRYDPDELVELWGISGIGNESRLPWRIFIPISDGSKPVSWTTRAIGEKVELRYLSAPPEDESVPLKHLVGGLQHVYHSVVVVEGPFDMFRIGPGSVCTFGLTVTSDQVLLLSKFAVRVIVFDNDPVAQGRAQKLANALSVFPGTTDIIQLSGHDPDTAPEEELEELRSRYLT